jgi:hypothetical protein
MPTRGLPAQSMAEPPFDSEARRPHRARIGRGSMSAERFGAHDVLSPSTLPTPHSAAPPPDLALGLMMIGAALAAAILLPGGLSGRSGRFLNTPTALAFAGVVALQMGAWALLTIPVWKMVKALWQCTRIRQNRVRALVVALAFGTLTLGPFLLSPNAETPFAGEAIRNDVLACIGAVLSMVVVLGIALTYGTAREHLPGANWEGSSDRSVEERRWHAVRLYLTLHAYLLRLVMVLGFMTAFAILSGVTLHVALAAWYQRSPTNFPASAVFGWGLYATFVVALTSLPYVLALRGFAQRMKNEQYEVLPPGTDGYEKRQRERREVDQLLRLNVITLDALRGTLAVLAPVLTGLVSLVPAIQAHP